MTLRENILAILHYEKYDKFPVLGFGFWKETLEKWVTEKHLSREVVDDFLQNGDRTEGFYSIMNRLGFDYDWGMMARPATGLLPSFEKTILEVKADGSHLVRDTNGLLVLEKPGIVSIPAEVGTTLTGRQAWEELYLPKLQWNKDRIDANFFKTLSRVDNREYPRGLYCGSLYGFIRDLLGVEELSYLYVDDEDLYIEIIDTVGNLAYRCVEGALKTGEKFDYAHFWEDICFKNGPLVNPSVFAEYIGPHYKRITSLLNQHGVDIVSVDCDGCIDSLLPVWLENGVNTMFPIEVGTWNASIAPWREKYGTQLRGVGGMDKKAFAKDYKAIDAEIERLKPLMEMGGYLPCPDHLISPDAKFENVQYYCDKMHNLKL